jgi:hypothetical protein
MVFRSSWIRRATCSCLVDSTARDPHFERLADHAGVSRDRVVGIVRHTIQRAMATWPETPLDPVRMAHLRQHAERLPLLRDVG